uniref:DNA-directed RNA polymerase III subunit n=1 Tax=Kalanchoe fedtschenkoi TaxID=63787 RepID=A0A7N0RIE2_KALFE
MAFRGRGRGRGGGGRGYGGGYGGMGHAKPAPVVLFPDVKLPEHITIAAEEKWLCNVNSRLLESWKNSAYYIKAASQKSQSVEIERFSDKNKTKRTRRRENLDAWMKCNSFPVELHDVLLGKRGSKQRAPKRVRSSADKGLEKLDLMEKLEQDGQKKEAEPDKPKKEGEEDDDAEEEDDEEDAEYSDDGDYNQNEYFDDDEDDYNDGLGSDREDEALL